VIPCSPSFAFKRKFRRPGKIHLRLERSRTDVFWASLADLSTQYLRLFRCHVLRYLAQHPLLGILNVATVALGVALYLAIQIANHSANRAFEASVDIVAGKAQLQASAPAGNLPEELFPNRATPWDRRRDSDRAGISDPARFSWRISRPVGDRRPD
jgi:hypothetical protein